MRGFDPLIFFVVEPSVGRRTSCCLATQVRPSESRYERRNNYQREGFGAKHQAPTEGACFCAPSAGVRTSCCLATQVTLVAVRAYVGRLLAIPSLSLINPLIKFKTEVCELNLLIAWHLNVKFYILHHFNQTLKIII